MTFRIGIIDYLNTQPFQYDLEARLRPRGVEFVRGVPTQLNRALLAGEIDLAPISAVFAAEYADEFVILPGHSISSLGAVKTVLLFNWRPDIHELDGQTIALTDHSATSVALLQVLCRKRYGIAPRFVTMRQELSRMMQQAAAALVIGDTALVESFLHRELPRGDFSYGRPTIFDLGDEWLKLTGLPFTFAVWAARRRAVDRLLALGVPEALAASKAAGLADLRTIAAGYAPTLALPAGVCLRYLRDLRYDLSDSDLAGLMAFLKLALPDFEPASLLFLEPALRPV
ncbi:MAG: menaquinone biosynthesis protein [Chloroflexi bacterium]|nr:menaquinone biosynthesis protein [Chloroflexota bacterium]MCI0579148.1 menaquinone biosynthesis protein [Chloroflexota bacterium]MCI0643658.1 menaquinone biosynthesis protein [Chloroflexota bacterium]MCI0726522.1 menaquinone biosynthesis protein [Chloroflexota bacterium]